MVATLPSAMRYLALATDYDDTIATRGHLGSDVKRALERLRTSGRRAVLITGRTLDELLSVCPDLDLFAAVMLENGAVLHVPSRRETRVLCPPVPDDLVRELARAASSLSSRAARSSRHDRPHEVAVLEAIRDLGLELQIIFNGDAVMVPAPGVNKGSGLRAALRELDLSIHEAVGVGNGPNDHSFLDLCECAVAVGNAIDAVKAKADFTTSGVCGAGVVQLIDELVATDLADRVTGGVGDVVVLAQRRDGDQRRSALTDRTSWSAVRRAPASRRSRRGSSSASSIATISSASSIRRATTARWT